MNEKSPKKVSQSVLIPLCKIRCFELFTSHIGEWWPRNHSPSGTKDSTITLEKKVSGRFFSKDEKGKEIDLGKIVEWNEPNSFSMDWYLGTGTTNPTRVHLSFTSVDSGTKISVEHFGPERVGPIWFERVSIFIGAWDDVLTSIRIFSSRT